MLVQDWLRYANLTSTLQCFVDECKRNGKAVPGPDKWFRLLDRLQFDHGDTSADEWEEARRTQREQPPPPLLESIVRYAITEREQIINRVQQQQQPHLHQQPTVLVSKRVMQVKELRLLSKRRGLSEATSTPVLREPPASSARICASNGRASGGLRPKSAAVCNSTSELIARSLLSGRSPDSDNQESPSKVDRAALKAPQSRSRPISAIVASTNPSQLSISKHRLSVEPQNSDSQGVTSPLSHRKSATADGVEDSGRHARLSSRASLSLIVEDMLGKQVAQPNETESGCGEAETPAGPETPALEPEDMTEERLTAHFSSLDKFAITKLRRVLAKSSACTQEFEKAKRTIDKIQAKAKLRQERRTLAAEQTQLLSHSTDALNKVSCALCQYVFLKTRLVMNVSYKSILDLQQSWLKTSGGHEHARKIEKSSELSPESECDPAASDDRGDRMLGRAQQAQLYDEVPICAFCSQLVLHSSSYRVRSPRFAVCLVVSIVVYH